MIHLLRLFNNYSKVGCEFECAVKKATYLCKCIPWYLPNNFTEFPMCELFGSNCFDDIISDETFYKECSKECLNDCKGVTASFFATYVPLDLDEICESLDLNMFEDDKWQTEMFDVYKFLTTYT